MYQAIVAKLERVRKHTNADNLFLATCLNSQVIVDNKAKEGDVVLFFGDDGVLSNEFAFNNNLYSDTELNIDKTKKGYFSKTPRVRSMKLRGEKSEAFVIGLESLKFTKYDISKLKLGDAFCKLNNIPICKKYITEKTLRAAKSNIIKIASGFNKKEFQKYFPKHIDTEHFKYMPDEAFLGLNILSLKKHGTSHFSGYNKAPVELPEKWYDKLWNTFVDEVFFGPKHIFNFFLTDTQKSNLKIRRIKVKWQKIYSTRNVIQGEVKPEDDHYRANVHKMIEPYMEKGEIWYGEIVGYEQGKGSSPIMQTVSIEKFKPFISKDEFKQFYSYFGDTITYKYGCLPGTFDFYVYRIAVLNEDNKLYELPWDVVKKKCLDAGIKPVFEFERHLITDISQVFAFRKRVEELTEELLDPIDPSHIREGICIRTERLDGSMKITKSKNFMFKIGEGIVKDTGTVDTEEVESLGDNSEQN